MDKILALRMLESTLEQDDPFWEDLMQNYRLYNVKKDSLPYILDFYLALGISKKEYTEVTGDKDYSSNKKIPKATAHKIVKHLVNQENWDDIIAKDFFDEEYFYDEEKDEPRDIPVTEFYKALGVK